MKLFSGRLLSVETGEYNSLVFATKKFDVGLSKFVDCSESVGISKECLGFVGNYKAHIGKNILVGISVLKTKKGGLFCLAETDVLSLDDLNLFD